MRHRNPDPDYLSNTFLVTEQEITGLRQQLEELEQLNLNVTSKIPCSQSNSTASGMGLLLCKYTIHM